MLTSVQVAFSADNRDQLNALLATTEPVAPVIRVHAGMLSVLFPWVAFKLLVKASKFGPSLHRFKEIYEDLLKNGFPLPDPVTGNFDAIDRYIAQRNPKLMGEQDDGEAITDEAEMLRRIMEMG